MCSKYDSCRKPYEEISITNGDFAQCYDGLCWTYSPMVDISIDPRWGRVAEGAGEDPFLGSRIAEAMVRGYQGDGSAYNTDQMMACRSFLGTATCASHS